MPDPTPAYAPLACQGYMGRSRQSPRCETPAAFRVRLVIKGEPKRWNHCCPRHADAIVLHLTGVENIEVETEELAHAC